MLRKYLLRSAGAPFMTPFLTIACVLGGGGYLLALARVIPIESAIYAFFVGLVVGLIVGTIQGLVTLFRIIRVEDGSSLGYSVYLAQLTSDGAFKIGKVFWRKAGKLFRIYVPHVESEDNTFLAVATVSAGPPECTASLDIVLEAKVLPKMSNIGDDALGDWLSKYDLISYILEKDGPTTIFVEQWIATKFKVLLEANKEFIALMTSTQSQQPREFNMRLNEILKGLGFNGRNLGIKGITKITASFDTNALQRTTYSTVVDL